MDRQVRAFVYQDRPEDLYRVGRTLRSLRSAGIPACSIGELTQERFRQALGTEQPVLFLRAGTWLCDPKQYSTPLPSASGKGLCAAGGIRPCAGMEATVARAAADWHELVRATGGDLSRLPKPDAKREAWFAAPPSLFLDEAALAVLRQAGAASFAEVSAIGCERFRVVHAPALDVFAGPKLRVFQVITALQRGGAERVTLDLLTALREQGAVVQLATLGRALRESFSTPAGTIELGRGARASAAALLEQEAISFGADVIHAHLLDKSETCAL
jgi:hypothetical protein